MYSSVHRYQRFEWFCCLQTWILNTLWGQNLKPHAVSFCEDATLHNICTFKFLHIKKSKLLSSLSVVKWRDQSTFFCFLQFQQVGTYLLNSTHVAPVACFPFNSPALYDMKYLVIYKSLSSCSSVDDDAFVYNYQYFWGVHCLWFHSNTGPPWQLRQQAHLEHSYSYKSKLGQIQGDWSLSFDRLPQTKLKC